MQRIDLETAVRELDRAVALKGEDYIYALDKRDTDTEEDFGNYACEYADMDQETGEFVPGCIVGHVFHSCGMSIDLLSNIGGAVGVVVKEKKLDVDEDAAGLLRLAQAYQDAGYTWGDAVRKAKTRGGVHAEA